MQLKMNWLKSIASPAIALGLLFGASQASANAGAVLKPEDFVGISFSDINNKP